MDNPRVRVHSTNVLPGIVEISPLHTARCILRTILLGISVDIDNKG
jgi:hypothetical protein